MSISPRLLYPTIVLSALLLLWLGSQNRPDPIWIQADEALHQPCAMLSESVDSLQALYRELHPGENLPSGDSVAFKIVSKPYLRTLAFDRLAHLTRTVRARKPAFVVVSGVTGTGSTKLAEKAASLLASNPDSCILTIRCAPEFDIEMHKKYIGREDESTKVFKRGELLQFWDRCLRNPKQRFVCMIDNFDKINPESFFGPDLWEMLGTPREKAVIGGQKVEIPTNFTMISVTHLGPGSKVEFNEEHFKRLGMQYIVEPNVCEMIDYFRQSARELAPKAKNDHDIASRMEILLNTPNQRRLVFYFLKTNVLIRERYGVGYELGQGSNMRKFYRPEDAIELKNTYLNHINSLGLARPMTLSDFEDLDYTVCNNGLEPNTNLFARQLRWLRDTGYFVEITMVGATALLTTLIGWWLLRRRERMIRNYGTLAQNIFSDFEAQLCSADDAARRLEEIKSEVNDLVLKRKLNYTEGLYFMAFVEDKVRSIEYARNVSENFLELYNAFMEDNVLTENEYLKLRQFLHSMRHKIPEETYHEFNDKVERSFVRTDKNPE